MARIREEQQLVPSVLDRLIDEEPDKRREPPKSRSQVLRELRQSVRRDLEQLLNTRHRCVEWPPNLDQLDASLVNYGIPDFTGASMSSPADREQFRRVVEWVIRKFEPRFKSVKVDFRDEGDTGARSLALRIDAVLYAEPAPEPVVFDSQLEPTTGSFEIVSRGQ
jgi:type VI secretion system protein ImpF